jgi:hypothetical protein
MHPRQWRKFPRQNVEDDQQKSAYCLGWYCLGWYFGCILDNGENFPGKTLDDQSLTEDDQQKSSKNHWNKQFGSDK